MTASPIHSPVNARHAGSGVPRKVLLGLALGVVVAHALVLQVAGNAIDAQVGVVARPFTTRAVPVSVAEAAPDTAAPARLAAPTPPRAAPRPRKRPVANLDAAPAAAVVSVPDAAVATAEPSAPAGDSETPKAPESLAAAAPQPVASAPQANRSAMTPATPASTPAAPPPVAAVAYTIPGSVRLLYKTVALVDSLNWNLNGELLWLQDGNTYDARLQWRAPLIGSKVFTSTGRIGNEGLLPTRFSDKFRSSEVAAHFERDKQMVVFSANTPQVPLLAGMQDQLSVFVQVSAMLGGAPGKFPPGTELTFVTIGARSPDTWVFVINGEERLSLPGGDIDTLKLSRGARREFDQTAELWLAPSLGYLPVRIKISERNGDFIDQQWRATETP